MNAEEYTQIVSDQIRSKKARSVVVKELQDHIMDQAAAYEAEGQSKEEALDRAVIEMGDPAEVGVELDRIHRPQMSWGTIAMVGLISVLSLLVQFLLPGADAEVNTGMVHLGYVLTGFILMIVIYRMDYSMIGKYSRLAAAFVGSCSYMEYTSDSVFDDACNIDLFNGCSIFICGCERMVSDFS